jgi:predicted RecB family endonuclease
MLNKTTVNEARAEMVEMIKRSYNEKIEALREWRDIAPKSMFEEIDGQIDRLIGERDLKITNSPRP